VGWTVVLWAGSLLFFFIAVLIYSELLEFKPGFFEVAQITWTQPVVALQIVLIPVLCIAIDILSVHIIREWFPSSVMIGSEENRCVACIPHSWMPASTSLTSSPESTGC
jgi:hypothetical protein